MLLRKQTSYAQLFTATMEFNPTQVGYEAGIVLWWNQFSYATVGVTLLTLPDGEKVQTIVRRSPSSENGVPNVSQHDSSLSPYCKQRGSHTAWQTTYPFLSPQDAPEQVERLVSQGPFEMMIRCDKGEYTLGLRQSIEEDYGSCRAEDLTVTPPVGGAFTGMMFGVYAFGKGEPVLDPADFTEIRVVDIAAGQADSKDDGEAGNEE